MARENYITFSIGTNSLLSRTAVMVTIKVSEYCYRTLPHNRTLRGDMQKEYGQPADTVVPGRRGACLVAPGDPATAGPQRRRPGDDERMDSSRARAEVATR
jgi:hypothetical protein